MLIKENFVTLLNNAISSNINNKYSQFIDNLPNTINDMPNILIYGPPGIGKYTEALKIIQKYSSSNLKYENL